MTEFLRHLKLIGRTVLESGAWPYREVFEAETCLLVCNGLSCVKEILKILYGTKIFL